MIKVDIKEQTLEGKKKENPKPTYLRSDYSYQTVGGEILDLNALETEVVYEIKCNQCEMSIRSQGQNIKSTYERLIAKNGCIGCGNKELVVKRVDMSQTPSAEDK